MQKPLALSIAVCLGLTGCQVFQKSRTWDKISKVHPGETTRDPDPSNAYAAKLHRALAGSGIEHKVVTYQFRYLTHLREEAVGTRTAVVYRDATNSKYPWWLKDDRLSRPFWLPNGELNKQISFYIRRTAEVLEHKDYSGGGASGKATLAVARPAVAPQHPPIFQHRSVALRVTPAPNAPASAARPLVAKKTIVKTVVSKKPMVERAPATKLHPAKTPVAKRIVAKPPVVKSPNVKPVAKTAPASDPVAPQKPVAAIRFRSSVPAPDRIPSSEILPPPPIASHSPAPWNTPTELSPHQRPKGIVHVDERLEKLFRQVTGTDYNPASPADRRRMEKLRKTAAAQE